MLLLPDMCPLRRAGDPQVVNPLDPPSPVRPQAPLPLSPYTHRYVLRALIIMRRQEPN